MSQLLPAMLIVWCGGLVALGVLLATLRYRRMQSHWISFPFLLPFLVMLWIHHALDLSDALMVATPPGQREAHLFNLIMVVVFYVGVGAYTVHTLVLAHRSLRWLAAKLSILVAYCAGIFVFWSRS
jgi:hypothetical protein